MSATSARSASSCSTRSGSRVEAACPPFRTPALPGSEERKKHGAEQLIEGHVTKGSEVLIVDDVTTEGGSVLKAVQGVRGDFECKVRYALSIVDRQQGATERLAAEGVTLLSFFKGSDFNLDGR